MISNDKPNSSGSHTDIFEIKAWAITIELTILTGSTGLTRRNVGEIYRIQAFSNKGLVADRPLVYDGGMGIPP